MSPHSPFRHLAQRVHKSAGIVLDRWTAFTRCSGLIGCWSSIWPIQGLSMSLNLPIKYLLPRWLDDLCWFTMPVKSLISLAHIQNLVNNIAFWPYFVSQILMIAVYVAILSLLGFWTCRFLLLLLALPIDLAWKTCPSCNCVPLSTSVWHWSITFVHILPAHRYLSCCVKSPGSCSRRSAAGLEVGLACIAVIYDWHHWIVWCSSRMVSPLPV